MANSAAASSASKPSAAEALRSAYHLALASASSRASARYSRLRATLGSRSNSPTRLRPGDGSCATYLELSDAPVNFLRPGGLRVVVDFCLETLDQFSGERRPFRFWQPEGLKQDLFRV